jgi:hypothetical protein
MYHRNLVKGNASVHPGAPPLIAPTNSYIAYSLGSSITNTFRLSIALVMAT